MNDQPDRPPFPWPYLTASIPGVGGVIKQHNDDFIVEEIPLYEACGEGTHTYLTIEKEGLTTPAAIRILAKTFRRKIHEFGYAGLKDAHGITRQTISIEHLENEQPPGTRLGRIKILSLERHTNKLKPGHLSSNRFDIKIRKFNQQALDHVKAVAAELQSRGVPNYFGPQRFGARGDNALIGIAVLRGDYDEAVRLILGRPSQMDNDKVKHARQLFDEGDYEGSLKAWPDKLRDQIRIAKAFVREDGHAKKTWKAVDHSLRKLYLSAVQSQLFNDVLAQRISSIDNLMVGDVAWKHKNGACFLVRDPAIEQHRCDMFDISPSGPLFGKKMKHSEGKASFIEKAVLNASKLDEPLLQSRGDSKLRGGRRPLRVPAEDLAWETGADDRGAFIQLTFKLPSGCYATCVTREICKTDLTD